MLQKIANIARHLGKPSDLPFWLPLRSPKNREQRATPWETFGSRVLACAGSSQKSRTARDTLGNLRISSFGLRWELPKNREQRATPWETFGSRVLAWAARSQKSRTAPDT